MEFQEVMRQARRMCIGECTAKCPLMSNSGSHICVFRPKFNDGYSAEEFERTVMRWAADNPEEGT